MSNIFKDKKPFCIEYKVKKQNYLFTLKAYSEEDAIKRFNKEVKHEIYGIYPTPDIELVSCRRIHKKIQF
jgi:hypothetical protein